MEIAVKALQFILSLSLLIVLHELGHYIPAKIFKTRVEKFYLFFDYKFSLIKKKVGETVYGIGWIPLGGYVKIAGMIDESMDTEQMKQEPKPWEFRSKPAWQRLIIMSGGVLVNFILAIFIYVLVVFTWGTNSVGTNDLAHGFSVHPMFEEMGFEQGDKIAKVNGEAFENVLDINKHLFLKEVNSVEVIRANGTAEKISIPAGIGKRMWKEGVTEPFSPRSKAIIDSVMPNSAAEKAGFNKGDEIIKLDNTAVTFSNEVTSNLVRGASQSIQIKRGDVTFTKEVLIEEEQPLGIYYNTTDSMTVHHKEYSFGQSIVKGNEIAIGTLKDYMTQFKYVFTKKGATSIGGFISIGKIFPDTWNWRSFWSITAFLSIILGFMNLLPIPALDGGHILFTLFEMVSGRKPNDKFLEYAQIAGFIFLMAVLLLANGNDIVKLIKGL